jgi:fibronectin type 3 domain-containing protein
MTLRAFRDNRNTESKHNRTYLQAERLEDRCVPSLFAALELDGRLLLSDSVFATEPGASSRNAHSGKGAPSGSEGAGGVGIASATGSFLSTLAPTTPPNADASALAQQIQKNATIVPAGMAVPIANGPGPLISYAGSPFPSTAFGIGVFEDQFPSGLSNAMLQFLATHTDGSQKMLANEIAALRSFNPNFTVLHYQLGTGNSPYDYIINNQWASDWTLVNGHEDWFAHQTYTSEPQTSGDLGSGRVTNNYQWNMADLANSAWDSYTISQLIQNMVATGSDAWFADSFTYGEGGGGLNGTIPARLQGTNAGNPADWPNGVDFFNLLTNWAKYIQSNFASYNSAHGTHFMFIPNLGGNDTSWEPNPAWYENSNGVPFIDGTMFEGFGMNDAGGNDAYDWTLSANRALAFTNNNKIFIAQMYPDAVTDFQAVNFYLASYLLVKGNESYINMLTGSSPDYWPEYQIPLGAALTPLSSSISSMLWNGVYRRDFQNGFVLVNPNSNSYTLNLGGNYNLVHGTGGGPLSDSQIDSTGNYIGGSLSYQSMSSITLAPGSAAIFLNPGPLAPTGLSATPGSASVALVWNASSGATSYNVYRGTSSGGETLLASGVTSTSYTDNSAANGTKYYYIVKAVDSAGTSGPSNEVSATPQSSTQPPPAPTGLTATAADHQVALTWNASTGATSYNVYRSTSSGTEALLVSGVTSTNYTDTGLTDGTTYFYKVKAANSAGLSGFSGEVSATPHASVSPPPAPTGLSASAGDGQVSLSWNASSGATSYEIFRGTSSGGETLVASNVTTTSFLDTGLTDGVKYYYEVKAVNSAGTSGFSNEASATPQVPPPAAPTGLSATAGNGQVVLKWNASSGATSYEIFRGTASGTETLLVSGLTSISFTDTSVLNGTTYFYVVKAVNPGGVSAASNEVSATPINPHHHHGAGLFFTDGINQLWLFQNGSFINTGAFAKVFSAGVDADGNAEAWFLDGNNQLWRYDNGVFTNIGAFAQKIAAGQGFVAFTDGDNQLWTFTDAGSRFSNTGGFAGRFTVGFDSNGTNQIVFTDGMSQLWTYDASSKKFTNTGGFTRQFVAGQDANGNSEIWFTDGNNEIWRLDQGHFIATGAFANRIAASSAGQLYFVDGMNQVWGLTDGGSSSDTGAFAEVISSGSGSTALFFVDGINQIWQYQNGNFTDTGGFALTFSAF